MFFLSLQAEGITKYNTLTPLHGLMVYTTLHPSMQRDLLSFLGWRRVDRFWGTFPVRKNEGCLSFFGSFSPSSILHYFSLTTLALPTANGKELNPLSFRPCLAGVAMWCSLI